MRAHARYELLEKEGSCYLGADGSILRRRVQRTRHTFDHLLAAYPEEQRDAMRAATRYEERLRDREQGIVTRLTSVQIAARYPEEAHRQATDGPYY